MTGPVEQFRTRLLPALLSAFGVTLLAAGLMTYTVPVAAEPAPSRIPTQTTGVAASPSPLTTIPPIGTATPAPPTATPPPPADRVATRIRIRDLGIDLPIIKGSDGYPACNVAMYLVNPGLLQPGFGKATYIYAHARKGMFLPLLETKGSQQRGAIVEVWTSDDYVFSYRITEVRRNQSTLNGPLSAESEELWLQTSEGPKGTVGKTQVVAEPVAVKASSHAAAHPTPRPVDCG